MVLVGGLFDPEKIQNFIKCGACRFVSVSKEKYSIYDNRKSLDGE